MKKPWRVQLVVEPDQEYFREAMLGARLRAFEGGRLEFVDRWLPHELNGDLRRLVERDAVRGILTASHGLAGESQFAAAGVPVVNVSNSLPRPRLAVVTQDDREVGRLAAEHLLGRGLRNFLFWGAAGWRYSDERREGFLKALRAAGVERGAVTEFAGASGGPFATRGELTRLRAVLAGLARPTGAFAVLDGLALGLLRAAREDGWKVPEELAVLGAGDDDFFVEFERTPLSSIRLPARQIGYEAAALLERLIAKGGRGGGGPEFIALPGARLVARRSTEATAPGDALAARAAALLRERPETTVAAVAKACGVARSGLQRRFIAAFGHGLKEERGRVRLERAERLLAGGEVKLAAVAAEAGYPSAQRLAAEVRRAHGCTPGVWRRRMRLRGGLTEVTRRQA